MTGFDKPNYTETPNQLFDDLMRDMSEAELKVTLCIIRQTFGYHKKSDPISLTQLEKATGLSRTACQSGVDAVVIRGLVTRSTGKRNVSIYTLVVNDDQSKIATSTSSEKLPVTSSNLLHTKETSTKETKQKKTAPTRSHPLFTIKYPSNIKSYTSKHIEAYNKEHATDLTALIHAWAGEMYNSLAEFTNKVAYLYIETHQELARLHIPCSDYPALVKQTRTKQSWKSNLVVTDVLLHVTDYKPAPAKTYDDPTMDLSKPQPTVSILEKELNK